MRSWLKLLIFLVPAVAGALFLLWRMSPEQTIIRRADLLLSCLEKKTLDGTPPSEKAATFGGILHPDFSIKAPLPIPSGPITPDGASGRVQELQESVLSCRISRADQRVTFPSDGRAVFEATLEADLSTGPSSGRVLRYRCQLEFVQEGGDWLLLRVVLTAI